MEGRGRFGGDAVIFVPYDGLKRFSDVAIDSIALWVRFYDVPQGLMTDRFMRALGAKIGKVLEVGEARLDYKRVKVDFQLANAIKEKVSIMVKEFGRMEFVVKYENIPHFCFVCGRIGHAARKCPEEGDGEGGVRFGASLRCSPQKRDAGKRLTIPAVDPRVRIGLNFSGAQKSKVMASATSSNNSPGVRSRGGSQGSWSTKAGGGQGAAAAELAKGVASMSVDSKGPSGGKDRVSGLNSFVDSAYVSEASGGVKGAYVSMQDRLRLAQGDQNQSGFAADSTMDAMEIDRQKRCKMAETDGLVDSRVQDMGFDRAGKDGDAVEMVRELDRRASSAKRYKISASEQRNLTGAQSEPRQEQ